MNSAPKWKGIMAIAQDGQGLAQVRACNIMWLYGYECELDLEDHGVAGRSAPMSISEPSPISEIAVFPNPTSGTLNISWSFEPGIDRALYSMSDAVGRQVLQGVLEGPSGEIQIGTAHLSEGIYLCTFRNSAGNLVYALKLMVKR
jgi:hypothetical protein